MKDTHTYTCTCAVVPLLALIHTQHTRMTCPLLQELEPDTVALMAKRVYDVAGVLGKGCKVCVWCWGCWGVGVGGRGGGSA